MSEPTNSPGTVRDLYGLQVNTLQFFFDFMREKNGTPADYGAFISEFKHQLMERILETACTDEEAREYVYKQLSIVEVTVEEFANIMTRFGVLHEHPPASVNTETFAMSTNSLPIEDMHIMDDMLQALMDGVNVFDMPDTAPLKHWNDSMTSADMETIASRFLVISPGGW